MKRREGIETNSQLVASLPVRKAISWDLLVGLVFLAGGLYLEMKHDGEPLVAALPATASLVGVIVGLSLAAMAVQASFLDLEFLRIAIAAGNDPVIPLRTSAWTVLLGVLASLLVIFRSALPSSSPTWLAAASGAATALFVGWAIASVPANVTTLIQAIRVRSRASEIDAPALRRLLEAVERGDEGTD